MWKYFVLKSNFHKRLSSEDGLNHKCKTCRKNDGKNYRIENQEKIKYKNKKYYNRKS